MNRQISFKHMDNCTPDMQNRIMYEIDRINKYFDGRIDIKWTCTKNGNFYQIELQCYAPKFTKHASARSANFDKCCEVVVKKLEKQLKKHKDRLVNKMHRKNPNLEILDPENAWLDYDEDYFADVG